MNVIAGETAVTAVIVSKFPGYGIKAVQSLIFGPDPDDAVFIPDEFPHGLPAQAIGMADGIKLIENQRRRGRKIIDASEISSDPQGSLLIAVNGIYGFAGERIGISQLLIYMPRFPGHTVIYVYAVFSPDHNFPAVADKDSPHEQILVPGIQKQRLAGSHIGIK